MATKKQTEVQENETENLQAEVPAQTEGNPADEIKTLKEQVAAMQDLLKQALGTMAKTAEEVKAEPKKQVEVTDATGASLAGDEGTAWEEYEEVFAPRARKGQEKSIVVTVNDRNVQIPLDGKYYRLRKPHAEIFRDSMEAEAAAEDFADSVPNDAAPKSYEQLMAEMADLKSRLKDLGINV